MPETVTGSAGTMYGDPRDPLPSGGPAAVPARHTGVAMFWVLFLIGVAVLAALYVWLDGRADPRWRRTRDTTDPTVWLERHRHSGDGGFNG